MDNYITGKMIKELRENKKMTQLELANILQVSDKTISKWETFKGLPDISLISPLAKALGVSVIELMEGKTVENKNTSSNMKNSKFYVCPVCGNIIHSNGESIVSCCGITLPKLDEETDDINHTINCEIVENEYYIRVDHSMTKEHFVSFIAYVTTNRCELVKLYPEQSPEARFLIRGNGIVYIYCNKEGLFKKNIKRN